jgi:hypothetical protein
LRWRAPDDDGGCDITHYVIEKEEDGGRWVPCGESPNTQFKVAKLREGHEYKFRVKAVNRMGESKPLSTPHSIIAKNPFGKNNFRFLKDIVKSLPILIEFFTFFTPFLTRSYQTELNHLMNISYRAILARLLLEFILQIPVLLNSCLTFDYNSAISSILTSDHIRLNAHVYVMFKIDEHLLLTIPSE